MRSRFGITFFILMISIYIIANLYLNYQVLTSYRETTCTITNTSTSFAFVVRKYSYQVSYTADSKTYTSWTNVIMHSYPSNLPYIANSNALKNLGTGNTTACWYDPADPNKVSLVKGFQPDVIAILLSVLVGIFLWLFSMRFNKPGRSNFPDDYPSTIQGDFKIRENRYIKEYVYIGNAPLTAEKLPKNFKYGATKAQQIFIDKINKNGKYVTFNRTLGWAIMIFMILMLIMMIG